MHPDEIIHVFYPYVALTALLYILWGFALLPILNTKCDVFAVLILVLTVKSTSIQSISKVK